MASFWSRDVLSATLFLNKSQQIVLENLGKHDGLSKTRVIRDRCLLLLSSLPKRAPVIVFKRMYTLMYLYVSTYLHAIIYETVIRLFREIVLNRKHLVLFVYQSISRYRGVDSKRDLFALVFGKIAREIAITR